MFNESCLPDQRRGDETADHRIERGVAIVAEVEEAAPVGLARRTDQQEAAEHQDERGYVNRDLEPRSANQRIGSKSDRRRDDEADDIGDDKQRANDVGREAQAASL